MPGAARKPTTERRAEIVQAVLRIIGERGLTSLSTAAIAEELGLSTGAMFRHFPSMEAVLREVLRSALARIEATFPDPALPPLERLLQLAANRVALFRADAGLAWLLRSDQAYLTLPVDAVEQLRDLVERSKRYLLTALRDGAADGSIRSDIPPRELLLPVMGTIHALVGPPGIHRIASGGRRPNADRVLAALAKLLAPPVSPHRSTRRSAPADTTRRRRGR